MTQKEISKRLAIFEDDPDYRASLIDLLKYKGSQDLLNILDKIFARPS